MDNPDDSTAAVQSAFHCCDAPVVTADRSITVAAAAFVAADRQRSGMLLHALLIIVDPYWRFLAAVLSLLLLQSAASTNQTPQFHIVDAPAVAADRSTTVVAAIDLEFET